MRALLFFLPLLLFACSPKVVDAPPVTELEPIATSSVPDALAPYGMYREVEPGQTLRARESPTSAFTFVEVSQDSRCPTGVSCVVAGEAVVAVQVGDDVRTIKIEAGKRGSVKFGVPDGYVEVTALDPYPVYGTKTEPGDYRLTARIIKAAQQ